MSLEPPADAPVAFGGQLSAETLVSAHWHGLFPMPCDTPDGAEFNEAMYATDVAAGRTRLLGGDGYRLAWWSPDPRPVLTADTVRLGTGLTKTLCTRRRWVTTVDLAFDRVLAACRVGREPRWLTDDLVAVMTALHHEGWYHSLEVWSANELVGGAVGLGLGAVFSADTMFHSAGGASAIALADLAVRLADAGPAVLDLQWDSPHARRLGATLLDRSVYLRLAGASGEPLDFPTEPRIVDDLLTRLRGRVPGGVDAVTSGPPR